MEYSIGEFARQLGVTKRTLYHYDQIGLFTPSKIKNDNHRVYTDEDIVKFQKIVTLKYIGFTLEEIEKIIHTNDNIHDSLVYQRNKLEAKKINLIGIINSIDEMVNNLDIEKDIDWKKHNEIINLINSERDWIYESQNIVNLKHRTNIYDEYSEDGNVWKEWVFSHLDFTNVDNILELGCGDGSFWKKNSDKIPRDIEITLSDISPEVIKNTKSNLEDLDNEFIYKAIDMMNIPYADNSFDLIYIEHALYLTLDINKTLSEINRVLKPGGKLYATVISNEHFHELSEILWNFKKFKMAGQEKVGSFCLENAKEQFEDYFDVLKRYERMELLHVTEALPLVNYVVSCGDAHLKKMSITEKNKLNKFMGNIISEKESITLTNLKWIVRT